MSNICDECDLSRCGIGDKPKCIKHDAANCQGYVQHLCRSCESTSSCRYVCAIAKEVEKYQFIKESMPTSRGGIIITKCDNYKFVPNKPRGKAKTKVLRDFLEEIGDGARGYSKGRSSNFI